ncbi:hypothetical protein L9F63_017664, partial [Diploptera punctata]
YFLLALNIRPVSAPFISLLRGLPGPCLLGLYYTIFGILEFSILFTWSSHFNLYLSRSLWSEYSMLKANIKLNDGIDISSFSFNNSTSSHVIINLTNTFICII